VVGEFREDGQKRSLALPSVVTLESFCYVGGLSANVFEEAMAPKVLRGQIGEDRELNLPRLLIGGLAPEMIDGKLPPKVIESTAQVMHGVPDHQPPVLPDLGHPLGDKQNVLSLRVKLPAGTENARGTPSIRCLHDGSAEVAYVAMRAVKLRPASSETLRCEPD
jgi:hypothetical protein